MKPKNNPKVCYIGPMDLKKTDEFFLERFRKVTDVKYVPISQISLLIDNGINFVYEYEDISKYDVIFFRVPRSKYSLSASILESLPKDVVSLHSPKAFYFASSRLSLYRALSKAGINTPRVIFSDNPQVSIFDLRLLRFPILIKVPTDKKKVMIANSQQEAKSMVDALQVLEQPILFEEYYPEANLIHTFVLGGKVVASVRRTPKEINYAGGELKKVSPAKKVIKVALEVADVLNADFLRVDILDTAEPVVVDVNLCPLIYNFTNEIDTEIFDEIVKYTLAKFNSKEETSRFFEEVTSAFTSP